MTDESANSESGPAFAQIVRGLLFHPLDSPEFASALQLAGREERAFTQEILEYMIEKNLSKNAELEERMGELTKVSWGLSGGRPPRT
jgi:hypothetical protein